MQQQQQQEMMAIAPARWQDGVCDCFNDGGICAQSTVCNICTASSIFFHEETNTATPCDCGSCCILWCTSGCQHPAYIWLPVNGGLTMLMTAGLRRTLIERYGIQGESMCASCLMGVFCNVCTMCQVQREMKARGQFVGGICAAAPDADGIPANPPQQQRTMMKHNDPAAKQPLLQQQQQPVMATAAAAAGPADWGTGLFDCAGAPDCCEAFWCWCSVVGHMSSKVNQIRGVEGAAETDFDRASCFGSVWAIVTYNFLLRRELVERYTIATEPLWKSCLGAVCCSPCVLAQSRREMGLRGEYPGGLWLKEMPTPAAAEAATVQ